MEQMQFTAIVLMVLLTLKLALLPARVAAYPAINKSRWLIASGTAILAIHFLLQLALDLRAKGITQSVMLNLAMFIPCSYLCSVAMILLQRQGRITKMEKLVGLVTWCVSMMLILIACAIDNKPLLSDSHEKHVAEIAASICYGLMLLYYFWRHVIYMKAMRTTLQNYYDWIMEDNQLRWMQFTILILVSVSLTVPLIIYGTSKLLVPYGLFFFASIFYFVDSFCSYVQSSVPRKLQEAEESERNVRRETVGNDKQKIDNDTMDRVGHLIEQWLQGGGYLQNGLKMPNAASEINIPQYLLSAWLRQKNMKYSEWITDLRISEAKRIFMEHPDWSNETVALRCGFTDRSYFQTIFKKRTGMTPAEFIQTTHKE